MICFIVVFASIFSAYAFTPISCEMVERVNPKNKISITIEQKDLEDDSDGKYAFKESEGPMNDIYWMSVELNSYTPKGGELSVVLNDENDEVGSFSCDLSKVNKRNSTICKEPVYGENGDYLYDITCFFKR